MTFEVAKIRLENLYKCCLEALDRDPGISMNSKLAIKEDLLAVEKAIKAMDRQLKLKKQLDTVRHNLTFHTRATNSDPCVMAYLIAWSEVEKALWGDEEEKDEM